MLQYRPSESSISGPGSQGDPQGVPRGSPRVARMDHLRFLGVVFEVIFDAKTYQFQSRFLDSKKVSSERGFSSILVSLGEARPSILLLYAMVLKVFHV